MGRARETNLWRETWSAATARGMWGLYHPAELTDYLVAGRQTYGQPWILFWDECRGFGDEREPHSLSVFRLEGGAILFVREVIWNRRADLSVLHQGAHTHTRVVTRAPTFQIRDAPADSVAFQSLLKAGTKFRLPIVWEQEEWVDTTDSGTRGFEIYTLDQPAAVLRLRWSSDVPSDWEPALRWIEQVRQFMADCLTKSA
jgi:hypothetical protein